MKSLYLFAVLLLLWMPDIWHGKVVSPILQSKDRLPRVVIYINLVTDTGKRSVFVPDTSVKSGADLLRMSVRSKNDLIGPHGDAETIRYNHKFSQLKAVHRVPDILTDDDRKKFILSVDETGPSRWRDTLCYAGKGREKYKYKILPVKLTNTDVDTLKYLDMSCSRLEIFTTNAKSIQIFSNSICDKNVIMVYKIPPGQTVKLKIPVGFLARNKQPGKFKIGIALYKDLNKDSHLGLGDFMLKRKDGNILWSNEVEAGVW